MILFHLAGSLFLFRWIFRDPKVDVRMLALGAVLPDLIDLPLGTLILSDRYSSGELWAHTLLAPSVLTVVVLLATRRGSRRRGWMALVVGWFFHLLLDGMWASTVVFLWPVAGLEFPRGPDPYWSGVLERALTDPFRWLSEIGGLCYLIVLARRLHLREPAKRAQLLRYGRLPS